MFSSKFQFVESNRRRKHLEHVEENEKFTDKLFEEDSESDNDSAQEEELGVGIGLF